MESTEEEMGNHQYTDISNPPLWRVGPSAARLNKLDCIFAPLGDLFAVWADVWKDGKWNKVPFNPVTLRPASTTNTSDWFDYRTAMDAFLNQDKLRWAGKPVLFNGVGLLIHKAIKIRLDGNLFRLIGADFDECLSMSTENHHLTGRLDGQKYDIIRLLNSYTEASPSGTGLKTLALVPDDFQLKSPQTRVSGIEIYDDTRFFTITGCYMHDHPLSIEIRPEEFYSTHDNYIVRPSEEKRLKAGTPQPKSISRTTITSEVPGSMTLSDEELLRKALASSSGDRIKALYDDGSFSGYNSQSEADLALMNHLSFWCNGDTVRMERLFSKSALGQRLKWTAESNYRKRTIEKAMERFSGGYNPDQYRARVTAENNISSSVVASHQLTADNTLGTLNPIRSETTPERDVTLNDQVADSCVDLQPSVDENGVIAEEDFRSTVEGISDVVLLRKMLCNMESDYRAVRLKMAVVENARRQDFVSQEIEKLPSTVKAGIKRTLALVIAQYQQAVRENTVSDGWFRVIYLVMEWETGGAVKAETAGDHVKIMRDWGWLEWQSRFIPDQGVKNTRIKLNPLFAALNFTELVKAFPPQKINHKTPKPMACPGCGDTHLQDLRGHVCTNGHLSTTNAAREAHDHAAYNKDVNAPIRETTEYIYTDTVKVYAENSRIADEGIIDQLRPRGRGKHTPNHRSPSKIAQTNVPRDWDLSEGLLEERLEERLDEPVAGRVYGPTLRRAREADERLKLIAGNPLSFNSGDGFTESSDGLLQ